MVLSITLALNSGLCPKYHQLRSLRCFKLRWGFFSSCFYSFVFEPETLVLIIIFLILTEHQWDPRWSEAALQNRMGDLTENCSQDGRRPWGLHWPEPVPEHPHSRAELRQADQHALLRLEAGECRAARGGVKPHREDMLGFKITPSFSHRRVWRLGCTIWGPSLPPTPSSSPWTRRSWRRHSRPRPRSRRSKSATRRPWCALWRTRTSAWCAARKRFLLKPWIFFLDLKLLPLQFRVKKSVLYKVNFLSTQRQKALTVKYIWDFF